MTSRVLLNPSAGRGRGARRSATIAQLARRFDLAVEETSSAADLGARAARAAAEGVERLLVAGGDGTWHHAANALAGTATALAPIPLGTGNDLARELGYPLGTPAAFEAAVAGEVARIDLGRIGDRLFCGVAGVGFDAAVADYARERIRRLRGPAVYAWATVAALMSFRPPRARLRGNGLEFEDRVFLVAFANTSHYGGGMRIAPHADPTDGKLEVVIVRRISKLRLLAVFPRVYRGTHVGHPALLFSSVSEATVELDPPQLVNADGEGLGRTGAGPLGVSAVPGALAVVRPRVH